MSESSKLEDVLQQIQALNPKDLKQLFKLIQEILQQKDIESRGSGSMSLGKIPAKNLKADMGTNTIAGALNKSVWAKEQLVKHLDAGGTIETLPAHILAFLGAEAMDIVEKRAKIKAIDLIKDQVEKRKEGIRETDGYIEIPANYGQKIRLEDINTDALCKRLKELTVELPTDPFIRQPQAKSFGRGLSMDAGKQRKRKIFRLSEKGINETGEEEVWVEE